MSAHMCHLPSCLARCPPKFLFCREHWAMVPAGLQNDIYRTVKLRGDTVNETWAPWWRAQARATIHVLRRLHKEPAEIVRIDRIEKRELAFVRTLKRRKS